MQIEAEVNQRSQETDWQNQEWGVREGVDEENHTSEDSVNKGQDKGYRARADGYDSHNAAVYTPRIDPFHFFARL
jgi:hypothetical protein